MRRGQGFTLLEMLIVIAITAVLVTTAVQAHLGIRRAQERAAVGLHRERAAHVFLDRFERELMGTLLLVRSQQVDRLSHPWVFVGRDFFESDADADALRFVTQNPLRAGPLAEPTGMRLVTYAVRTSDDGGLDLVREERPLPEALEKEPVVEGGQVALDDLATFRLRYLDGATEEWREDWDSTDVALLDRIPTSVEVQIALYEKGTEGDPARGPEQTRVVTLPVRPLDLVALREGDVAVLDDANAPDDEEDEEASDGASGCVIVSDCADLSEVPANVANLITAVGKVCDPTEIAQLKQIVEVNGGTWTCP